MKQFGPWWMEVNGAHQSDVRLEDANDLVLCHQKAASARAGDNLVSALERCVVDQVPIMVEEGLLSFASCVGEAELEEIMSVVKGREEDEEWEGGRGAKGLWWGMRREKSAAEMRAMQVKRRAGGGAQFENLIAVFDHQGHDRENCKGLFWWLGTRGETKSFSNPAPERIKVAVRGAANCDDVTSVLSGCAGAVIFDGSCREEEGCVIELDVGTRTTLAPTKVTVLNGEGDDASQAAWSVWGSLDKDGWKRIGGAFNVEEAFRYIQLRSIGNLPLAVQRIELFGYFYRAA